MKKKHKKILPENAEFAEMRHYITMTSRFDVRLFVFFFISFLRADSGVDYLTWIKTTEIPNWSARNHIIAHQVGIPAVFTHMRTFFLAHHIRISAVLHMREKSISHTSYYQPVRKIKFEQPHVERQVT